MLGPISDALHNEKTVRITVCGVGGAGGNAVENMIRNNLGDIDYIAMNTDVQSLKLSTCSNKIQIGEKLTQGLGVGGVPEKGKNSALESAEIIEKSIKDSHIIFIAAGMGGGTGTGAAPVVASIAKKLNILTVAVVTMPFNFEGKKRLKIAEDGVKELRKNVDSIIVIPNQNLFRITDSNTTFVDSFKLADAVLCNGVKCITDLILKTGLINLDFADIRSIMENGGLSMMTTSTATGENRSVIAAEEALQNPLLNTDINNAKNLLISISGDQTLTLVEVDTIVKTITSEVSEDINVIFGAITNDLENNEVSVSVIATGLNWDDDFLDLNDSRTNVVKKENQGLENSNYFNKKEEHSYKIKNNTNYLDILDKEKDFEKKNEDSFELPEHIHTNSNSKIKKTSNTAEINNEKINIDNSILETSEDDINEDDFSFTENLLKKTTSEPDRLYVINTINKSDELEKRFKKKNIFDFFNSIIPTKKDNSLSNRNNYNSNIIDISDISKDNESTSENQFDLFMNTNKKNIKY